MSYKPADSYYKLFTTSSPSTGAAVNADSLPTATANHNGADDSSFTLTVTNVDTGRYKITGTIPSGYSSGDVVNIEVSATVSAIAGKAIVDTFVLDANRVGDIPSLILRNSTYKLNTDTSGNVTVALTMPSGLIVSGSTVSSVTVSGLPSGYQFTGQRLYNLSTGETRVVSGQAVSGSNYVFTLGTSTGESGPFTTVTAGNIIVLVP